MERAHLVCKTGRSSIKSDKNYCRSSVCILMCSIRKTRLLIQIRPFYPVVVASGNPRQRLDRRTMSASLTSLLEDTIRVSFQLGYQMWARVSIFATPYWQQKLIDKCSQVKMCLQWAMFSGQQQQL